jgi:hypothetical protein
MILSCKKPFIAESYVIEIDTDTVRCKHLTYREIMKIRSSLLSIQKDGSIDAEAFADHQIKLLSYVIESWSFELELSPENIERLTPKMLNDIYCKIMGTDFNTDVSLESDAKN